MATSPGLNPLFALTPSQVNRAEPSQWRQIIRQALADTRCASPAFLTADMDVATQTVTVQIALQERVRTVTGPAWQDIPPITMVPICVPRGGGGGLTLPLKKGDEGLLIFCDTCFDFWWAKGQTGSPPPTQPAGAAASGSQRQNEIRRHYLHDCGFFPGMWSQPNVLADYSADSVQLRMDDYSAYVDVATNVVTLSGGDGVDSVAPSITATNGGTALALVNDNWLQWFKDNIVPFLDGLGYSGPPQPTASETTVFKAQ